MQVLQIRFVDVALEAVDIFTRGLAVDKLLGHIGRQVHDEVQIRLGDFEKFVLEIRQPLIKLIAVGLPEYFPALMAHACRDVTVRDDNHAFL